MPSPSGAIHLLYISDPTSFREHTASSVERDSSHRRLSFWGTDFPPSSVAEARWGLHSTPLHSTLRINLVLYSRSPSHPAGRELSPSRPRSSREALSRLENPGPCPARYMCVGVHVAPSRLCRSLVCLSNDSFAAQFFAGSWTLLCCCLWSFPQVISSRGSRSALGGGKKPT